MHVQQPMWQTCRRRIVHKPARCALLDKMYQVILDYLDDDPNTYIEAFEDVDVQEWKRSMDREMESIGSNYHTPRQPPRRMKGARDYIGTLYLIFQHWWAQVLQLNQNIIYKDTK